MENNNLKDAFKEDLNNSFGISKNIGKEYLKNMTTNPNKPGEFYIKRAADFSGTVSTKLGLKILIGATIIFIVGILGYTFFFY